MSRRCLFLPALAVCSSLHERIERAYIDMPPAEEGSFDTERFFTLINENGVFDDTIMSIIEGKVDRARLELRSLEMRIPATQDFIEFYQSEIDEGNELSASDAEDFSRERALLVSLQAEIAAKRQEIADTERRLREFRENHPLPAS